MTEPASLMMFEARARQQGKPSTKERGDPNQSTKGAGRAGAPLSCRAKHRGLSLTPRGSPHLARWLPAPPAATQSSASSGRSRKAAGQSLGAGMEGEAALSGCPPRPRCSCLRAWQAINRTEERDFGARHARAHPVRASRARQAIYGRATPRRGHAQGGGEAGWGRWCVMGWGCTIHGGGWGEAEAPPGAGMHRGWCTARGTGRWGHRGSCHASKSCRHTDKLSGRQWRWLALSHTRACAPCAHTSSKAGGVPAHC